MLVREDKEKGTFTIGATNEDERQILTKSLAYLYPGQKLDYRGVKGKKSGDIRIKFHIGGVGHLKQTSRSKSGGSVYEMVYEGGMELLLTSTTDQDQDVMKGMSDTCYMATGGLIFLEPTVIDNSVAIVCTASFCQHCGQPMIKMGRCEWKTCDGCVAICDHTWERGMVHGGMAGELGYGSYCSKCGTGKPNDALIEALSPAEQHVLIEQNLGVAVVYKNTLMSPSEIVRAEYLASREDENQ